MFKKPCPESFRRKGRSHFDERSVHGVRERERREERQVCEPEGRQNGEHAAGLSAVAMAKAGGFVQHSLKGKKDGRQGSSIISQLI